MLSGIDSRFAQFSKFRLSIQIRFPIDEGSCLIPVPAIPRYIKLSIGFEISGRLFRFEQPSRSRRLRDWNSKILLGRLSIISQASKLISWRPEQFSIDEEGISFIAVQLKSNVSRFRGSSTGNSSRIEHPASLRYFKDFSLCILLGIFERDFQPLRISSDRFSRESN